MRVYNYCKRLTITEINKLWKLEDIKYHEHLNKFIDLLEKATDWDQNIYWYNVEANWNALWFSLTHV